MTLNPQDRRAGLYAIVNVVNGHRYIGSTINFYNRTREHRLTLRRGSHHCGHLQRAWHIYGEAAFQFQVLALLEPADLRATEARMLARHINHDTCYNSGTTVTAPMLGRRHSAATRAAMSAAHRGKTKTAEHRAKIAASNRGRTRTDDTCARISAYHSRADVIEKHRAFHTGRSRPADARQRMSVAARQKSNARRYSFDGRSQTLLAWAEECGINRYTLYERIGRGWPVADALTLPVNAAMRPTRFRQEANS